MQENFMVDDIKSRFGEEMRKCKFGLCPWLRALSVEWPGCGHTDVEKEDCYNLDNMLTALMPVSPDLRQKGYTLNWFVITWKGRTKSQCSLKAEPQLSSSKQ